MGTVADNQSHQLSFVYNLSPDFCRIGIYLSKEVDWHHFQPQGPTFVAANFLHDLKKKISLNTMFLDNYDGIK